MKMVTVKMPKRYVGGLDRLVRRKMYPSRSAAIRTAIRDLLKGVLWVAEDRAALMETPLTPKRWLLVACPRCRGVLYIRRDWRSRLCPSCQRRFTIDFSELMIIGTFEKLSDARKHLSKPKPRTLRIESSF